MKKLNEIVYLNIGPLIYKITSPVSFSISDECAHFFYKTIDEIQNFQECTHIDCEIKFVTSYSVIQGDLLYQNPERMIFGINELEQRLYSDERGVYGIYYEVAPSHFIIELKSNSMDSLVINTYFLEMLALDRFLLRENALVLHSSFIKWNKKGIAFTAPSGTGKSTQAALWEKHAGARVINGDRSIIWWNKKSGIFEICGLPFCGSSQICLDERMPLRAVVFLEQASKNCAEKYPAVQASGKLFGEMSINQWNREFVDKSLEIIERLIDTVPMIHLSCNMDPDAVDELKQYVEE